MALIDYIFVFIVVLLIVCCLAIESDSIRRNLRQLGVLMIVLCGALCYLLVTAESSDSYFFSDFVGNKGQSSTTRRQADGKGGNGKGADPVAGKDPTGPGDGWGEPPRAGVGPRFSLLGSPMACGVAAGCGGCCVGVAFTPFTVPVGLGVMASAPVTFALVSPSGERYPDASEMSWAQAEERRRAMRASGVGVAIGAGIGGATITGLVLLTVLALSGATWTGPL